jgi:tetratricopeptide (TPR) repeat protein
VSRRDAEDRLAVTRNTMSGDISGQVVQARSIGEVHFHARAEHSIPAQLPPVPRSFASRGQELTILRGRRAEAGDQPLLVVLSGSAGVGKTSLALRWLHEVRGDYPDGQLFIDLAGHSPAPVVPSQALEWFLVALGVAPRRVPVEPARREALYRTETAGRSLIVLLDNAVSAAQIRPLIPAGSQGVVVVTSRWRLSALAMDGARWIDVDPLDTSGSTALLERIIGADRVAADAGAARELATLCGGLPLALSIVAARLSTRPQRTVAGEAADLRAEHRRFAKLTLDKETSVEAVLDVSYRALSSDGARLYRLCAFHPGREFGIPVAAATAGWTSERTESTVDLLVEANFLSEVDDRRFTYHDLLRLHARRRAEQEDSPSRRDAAQRRMVEWYLDRTVQADLVVHPLRPRLGPRYATVDGSRFADPRSALDWLELERSNLREALSAAAHRHWDELVWQLCEALWGFFLHTRHYSDWIELHCLGIGCAHRCGNRRAEARLRSQLGFAYAKLDRFDEATAENTEALALAEGEQDSQAKATALSQLGRVARSKGDLPAALRYFAESRDIQREIGEIRGVALCQRRIGHILGRLRRYDEALVELRAAASIMNELGDQTQYARTLMFLAAAYLHSGRAELADTPLREALTLMRELGSPYYQAEILAQLGEAAQIAGDPESARRSYQEAHELYLAAGDPRAHVMSSRLDALP